MKSIKISKCVFFLAVLVLAAACGKKNQDDDAFQSQVAAMGNSLTARLATMPVSNQTTNQTADLGPVLAYAYPNANQVWIADSRVSMAHAAYSQGGVTPGGVSWYRQGNTYTNGYGQPVDVGGGSAYGPAGGFGRWGYGYNTANGNHITAGLIYVPGIGLGVGVHGCSYTTGQCGTAVAGLGAYHGGYAYCVNGQCAGSGY